MSRIAFLSDLHLFTRRSDAAKHANCIRKAAEHADTMVLGGDIFDFHWSTVGDAGQTAAAAGQWLENLADFNRNCQIYYIQGNHDSNPRMSEELQRLSLQIPHFHWRPYFLRVDDRVFLHGDVADREMDHPSLERYRRYAAGRPLRGNLMNFLYDGVVSLRIHRLAIRLAIRRQNVVRRIERYLNSIGHGREDGVRHVYFGHTHDPMYDLEHGGMLFHNGGAPIRGLEFRILQPHRQLALATGG